MHIAIEGIKGSGKSTILGNMVAQKDSVQSGTSLFSITSPMYSGHPLENMHHNFPVLRENDAFMEHLFRERAHWNQIHCKKSPVILGDRSIVTSYVTRWERWQDPYYTIGRVNAQYENIMKPDVIIWLNSTVEAASVNIAARKTKELGQREEKANSLVLAKDIYQELFKDRLLLRKGFNCQIVEVGCCGNSHETTSEITSIFDYYSKNFT